MTVRSKEEWRVLGVELDDAVDPTRVSVDARIHVGCRLRGATTSVGPGCEIGREAPVTLEDCQLARDVELKGGYFSNAVFLDGANMGAGAHVRAGTILEEEAGGAHAVGLKQTLLFPFVTLGSLINFCDVFMAGGTSRKDHSEVGSSYVHFNFTPHQDKATASLLGDVPSGVFLAKKSIFLGGQGGLVGPARLAYGTVVAAGGVCREDVLEEDQLHVAESPAAGTRPYATGVYRRADRLIRNNLCYIGNILALRAWYQHVRPLFIRDAFDQAALDGARANLDLIFAERVKRLADVAGKFADSIRSLEKNGGSPDEIATQKRFSAAWPETRARIESIAPEADGAFIAAVTPASSYIETIQSLNPATRAAGHAWLRSIVDQTERLWETT